MNMLRACRKRGVILQSTLADARRLLRLRIATDWDLTEKNVLGYQGEYAACGSIVAQENMFLEGSYPWLAISI